MEQKKEELNTLINEAFNSDKKESNKVIIEKHDEINIEEKDDNIHIQMENHLDK